MPRLRSGGANKLTIDNGQLTIKLLLEDLHQELADTGSVQFYVRAVPNAPQTKVLEVMADDSVKIAVAAQPEKGKANVELLKFLKKEFGGNVQIISGQSARIKLVKAIL